MKCIKATKKSGETPAGTIKRVDDKEAHSRVTGGYWKYVPKSEWKGKNKVETVEEKPAEA